MSMFDNLTDNQCNTLCDILDYYQRHGYVCTLCGITDWGLAEQSMRDGIVRIQDMLREISNRYGTRGASKRALCILHGFLPDPAFGFKPE